MPAALKGGMALPFPAGDLSEVLPTPLGGVEGAAPAASAGAALATFALRVCRTGAFLAAGGVSASSGTAAGSTNRAPSRAICRGATSVF